MGNVPAGICCLVLLWCLASESQAQPEPGRPGIDPTSAARLDHSPYSEAVRATPGLVAYWPMEGDLRDAVGAINGEGVGTVAFEPGAIGGQAVKLDGTSFVGFGEAPELDLPGTTIELFFRALPPPAGGNPCLIAKRAASPQTRFSIHISADLMRLAVWNGASVGWIDLPQGYEVGQDRWHHLAVTNSFDGTVVYFDGLAYEGAVGFSSAKGLPLQVGSPEPGVGAEMFAGWVDEVAIYNRALSAEEIGKHVEAAGVPWVRLRDEALTAREEMIHERARIEAARLERQQRALQARLDDPALLAEGEPREYAGDNLTGIAFGLGGIGAGTIYMDGRAERSSWHIFSNLAGVALPETFFAVRATQGGTTSVRALQTSPVGPFEAMAGLTMRGEYPLAWYDFADDALPVRCRLEAYSPLIPMNSKDSAIPCAVFRLTAENPTDRPAKVSFLATQLNAVGYTQPGPIEGRRHASLGGNVNAIVSAGRGTVLHSTSTRASGDMVLAALAPGVDGTADSGGLDQLRAVFVGDGGIAGASEAGPSPEGEGLSGALSVGFGLGPRESHSVVFVLTWCFPETMHGAAGSAWLFSGNMYSNWWTDALDVARYVERELPRLDAETRLYHDTFYAGNLPYWLRDRITSQVAILRSMTCFWAKDGYFGAWEGCGAEQGCCAGNCAHVWHYAQAHARLFPDIGRLMRQETFGYQHGDGGLPHRQPDAPPAIDGELGEILAAYREYLCSTDGRWLAEMWPRVRAAMDHTIRQWDPNEDGILSGPQWNTLDGSLGGSTSWIGSLYLAGLGASERMARLQGDAVALERYAAIRSSGAKAQDETLFDGEYYSQIPDPEPQSDYNDGCSIDQVLGEWWARQVGVEPAYPLGHVRTALASLIRYNFRPDFVGVPQSPRKFVADEDAGLQMIQWPKGPRPNPCILYGDEAMTGFEYSAAAAMVQVGMLREGYMVAKAVSDRYDGRRRTGLTPGDTASWGYSGNPFGDDECGKFYGRALSVWSLLLASQGFTYDGPAGVIGFDPVYQPDNHASFFTAAEGWGLFRQTRDEDGQQDVLELRYGKLRLTELRLALPEGRDLAECRVSVDGVPIQAEAIANGMQVRVRLEREAALSAGQTMAVDIGCR